MPNESTRSARASWTIILVGTSRYEAQTGFEPLPTVRATILRLYQCLSALPGFSARDTYLHLDSADPVRLCNEVTTEIDAATGHLLFVYSGHGLIGDKGQLLLTLPGTRDDIFQAHAALPYELLRSKIADRMRCGALTSAVLILDCCYAGRALSALGTGMGTRAPTAATTEVTGAVVITSSDRNEQSFAPPDDEYTAFGGCLIDLFTNGIPGGPTNITWDDMFAQLDQAMHASGLPRPRMEASQSMSRRVVMANPPPGAAAASEGRRPAGTGAGAVSRRRAGMRQLPRAAIWWLPVTAVLVIASAAATAWWPTRPTAHPPRPAASATATAANPSSAPPGPSATATTAPIKPTGSIDSPAENADVQSCSYFKGSATLPPDTTLILVMRNITTGEAGRYVVNVFGWDTPASLSAWQGAQYFATVGQRYQVDLRAVDLGEVRKAVDAGSDARLNALSGAGTLLASRRVTRVPGQVPNDCEGP